MISLIKHLFVNTFETAFFFFMSVNNLPGNPSGRQIRNLAGEERDAHLTDGESGGGS